MSQTLWGKQKGPFAAPPEWTKHRSPYAVIPIWLLLPLTVIISAFSFPTLLAYYSCSGPDAATCGTTMPGVRDGTLKGVAVYTGLLVVVALLLGVVAALKLKRWPAWLCWAMAGVGLVLAAIAFLTLIGSVPNPFGEIIPRRASSG